MQEYLQVGAVTTTHGLKGEVKVFPTTDDPMRFKKLKVAFLETPTGYEKLEIQQARFFKNLVILKFKGLDRVEDVMYLKGRSLLVDRAHAVKLEENENFIADLIGMSVFTEDGALFGELTDVIQTGANDVYEVSMKNGGEVLIPAIRQCILDVNVEESKMIVHLLEGLL